MRRTEAGRLGGWEAGRSFLRKDSIPGVCRQLPGEPSVDISEDTVYTKDIERALTEFKPDVAVVAAGSATLDVGGPILMPLDEIITFVRTTPHQVIANQL